jgi:hypothetical protein
MELSPEERDRIFQEEKARRDVQKQLEADEKRKASEKVTKGCLGCLGVVLLLGVIVALIPSSKDPLVGKTVMPMAQVGCLYTETSARHVYDIPAGFQNDPDVVAGRLANEILRTKLFFEVDPSMRGVVKHVNDGYAELSLTKWSSDPKWHSTGGTLNPANDTCWLPMRYLQVIQ